MLERLVGPAVVHRFVMHPRRWAWLLTQNDTANRPLVVPEAYGPSNTAGVFAGGAEGRVGSFAGLPVYLDSGVPTTLGAGSNQDVVLVLNTAETILYESGIRTRASCRKPCPGH